MPANDFLLQVQRVEGNLDATEKLVLLQRIIAPNCNLECLETNDLQRHAILEGFLKLIKTVSFIMAEERILFTIKLGKQLFLMILVFLFVIFDLSGIRYVFT